MRRASVIAARGHVAARDAFLAGASEFEVHLAYCAASGQRESDLPYGNIIAFDAGAAVLHYQHLEHGRDVPRRSFLIDAGAQFRGYASDITRTWPAGDPEFAALVAGDGRAAARSRRAAFAPAATIATCTSRRTVRSASCSLTPASSAAMPRRRWRKA